MIYEDIKIFIHLYEVIVDEKGYNILIPQLL